MVASRRGRGDMVSATSPREVPAELTSFVGRRRDLTAVRQLCASARLVTLTGIGGVGKTRLALRVVQDVRRSFSDGVALVELAPLVDPALLPHATMDALGIREQATRTPVDSLCDHLRERQMLLVLDNCEHMVTAVADLVTEVLRAAPEVRIVATSRQPLRIEGEHVYRVSPLPAPPADSAPGTALQYPSLTLFAERAAAVVPGFMLSSANEEAVTRLCQRLEGIPLALELAAVRLRLMSVEELVDRLDDRFGVLREGNRNLPQRHRTLQAMVDWSHDLCTSLEQTLWARVSVFTGGVGLDALESVCAGDDGLPQGVLLDVLAGLLDKSILLREEVGGVVRYRMLDTIRGYGQARLTERGDQTEVCRRHRDWYLRLVLRADAEWVGADQRGWAERLHEEQANLRRALEFSFADPGEARAGLTLAAIPWFWGSVGHLSEGRLWLARGLAIEQEPCHERAWALATAAYVEIFLGGRVDPAVLEEARRLAVQLGDAAALAYATHVLGVLQTMHHDNPLAGVRLLTEALRLYAETGVPSQYPDSTRVELAGAHLFLEEIDEAAAVLDELHERCRRNGDSWNLSYALWGRGYVALLRGDLDDAESELVDALAMKRTLGDNLGVAFTVELLAWTAAARGETDRAVMLLGGVEQLWQLTAGTQLLGPQRAPFDARARLDLSPAEYATAFEHGQRQRIEETLALALRQRATSATEVETAGTTLTRRQREVAEMVATGHSNKEIADTLVISIRTAEGHVESILSRLGFTSRSQIARWVVQQLPTRTVG